MKKLGWVLAGLVGASTFVAAEAEAANYIVYVHGRSQTTWTGTQYGMSGWSKVSLNYNATTATLAQANSTVRSKLATYCSGANSCIIVAYSNGMHQVAYTQANYPEAISNALYIQSGGAAYGGSDLLDGFTGDLGEIFGAVYDGGVDDALHVSAARNAYNHNLTAGKVTYMVGGNTNAYNWIWYPTAGFLPGDDDGVVSFHSAFGCVNSGSQSQNCSAWSQRVEKCNYSSSYCDDGVCGGSWISAGTDHFGIDSKAAYCF